MTSLDHAAACELAEKRAIAVYGAVFALLRETSNPQHCHGEASRVAAEVPRPEPFRVPTALERQQAVQEWEARR